VEWVLGGLLVAIVVVGLATASGAKPENPVPLGSVQLGLVSVTILLALLTPGLDAIGTTVVAIGVVLAAAAGGGVIVRSVIHLAGHSGELAEDLPASAWIGVIERFGFSLALILGAPEIAAVIVAVKALGSYAASDRNRVGATRVLGTLTSIAWALLCFAVFWIVRARMVP
jgi:hypothetical protein